MLQSIAATSTQTGDAVTISVMKKAMELQAAQASQLIESAAQSVPQPGNTGQVIDIFA